MLDSAINLSREPECVPARLLVDAALIALRNHQGLVLQSDFAILWRTRWGTGTATA
jgi:hypothetical protein